MLTLKKRAESKRLARKKLASTSHSTDDISTTSGQVSIPSNPNNSRRVLLVPGSDTTRLNEGDFTTADLDSAFSTFDPIFEQLKSPISQERINAAAELNISLISLVRELSVEDFQRFSNILNNKIFELVHGTDSNEKIGGILAVDTLINLYLHTEELPNQTSRLANYLRVLIPSNDIEVMRLAANTLGKLAVPGGTLTSDFVDFEVKTCLEWLTSTPETISSSSKQEYRKHAALLLITALADNSPYLLYPYINPILENIWRALRDIKLVIRMDAAVTLRKCLSIIRERDPSLTKDWFQKLFKGCQRGLTLNTNESIHATLLVYRELLSLRDSFLNGKLNEIYLSTIKYKDHKFEVIRKEVYAILPLLSSFDTKLFIKSYLDPIMLHYLMVLKSTTSSSTVNSDKAAILVSIGDIAFQVKSHITRYIDPILDTIRDGLKSKFKHRKLFEKELFYCIGKLACAVGPALAKNLNRDLLDLMLNCLLSDYMQETFIILNKEIPALEATINSRLLDYISASLSGQKYDVAGTLTPLEPLDMERSRRWRNKIIHDKTGEINDDIRDAQYLTQALKMLRSINYKKSLTEFARQIIIFYIEHEDSDVRKLAALITCELFTKDPICKQISRNALQSVSEVLSKLLTVSITDPVSEIRLEVLRHLTSAFDSHLAQPDNSRLLFMAVNDEIFTIQIEAIKIVARLSSVNPAYFMPSLRKTLLELLTQLRYSNMPRKKEEYATLLYTMIQSGSEITKPYIEPVLDVLLPRCQDPSSSVASTSLKALGELSVVAGEDIKKHLNVLMPLIINTFQDHSSFKRNAALKTLSQLATSSSYVIEPLLDYPELLGILINILRGDGPQDVKRETIKLIGILGALDPYKVRAIEGRASLESQIEQNTPSIDIALLMKGMSPSDDEYYPTVVVNTLLKILYDPTLSSHHTAVIQAILNIYQSLGVRCVSFLDKVVPGLLSVMRTCTPSLLEFYFQQLSMLISIVRQHVRPYVDEIFSVIQMFFPIIKLQITIISTIEAISKALESEFKKYVPLVLTSYLAILENDKSNKKAVSIRILKSLIVLGPYLEDFSHLIIPSVVRMSEYSPGMLGKIAVIALGKLAKNINLCEMSSRIVQTLIRLLNRGEPDLIKTSMNTLCLLLLQQGTDFVVFIPILNKVLINNHIQHSIYDQLVNKLLNNESLPTNIIFDKEFDVSSKELKENDSGYKKLPLNQEALKNTWEASQQRTKEDWQEWLRRLSIQLIRESPSPALRACANLVSVYYPLARELFNASFSSCWSDLYSPYRDDLIKALCVALSSPQNPPEIYQTLLNLVEFMEHDDKPLPIPFETLGQYAQKCHAFAKALHYKEVEFLQEPTAPTIEALISINNELHQNDAAIGILKLAQQHHDLQLKEIWYEKLQRWEDALTAYNEREVAGEGSIEVTMGKMRALHALGEWEQLGSLTEEKWAISKPNVQKLMAPLAAGAAWGLGQWDKLEEYSTVMNVHSSDKEFFDAILCIHRNNLDEGQHHILNARDLLLTELSTLINESYNRAYGVLVRAQIVSELEEIISYKKLPYNSSKRGLMRKTWNKRLLGCQKNVDIWQRVLRIRSLVIKPKQDADLWIKFANLCRKSGRMGLAKKALTSLLEEDGEPHRFNTVRASPLVVYSQLKYLWAIGSQEKALKYLMNFTSRVACDLGLDPSNMISEHYPQNDRIAPEATEEYMKLLARCFLKQGEWRVALEPNWRLKNPDEVLGSYLLATHFDNSWYKAWHNWALANFEVISVITSGGGTNITDKDISLGNINLQKSGMIGANTFDTEGGNYPLTMINRHVIPAIRGFFHSISLSDSSSLQDALRLLTLWFTFGGIPEANQAMHEGFTLIKIATWLEVLPQLISRIHQPNQFVSRSLLSLLSELGKAYPQALVYPLTVAIKSESVSRQRAALSIIEKMRMHSPVLVAQAELVSSELIRVAVLWHELWYEGLENASRHYFGENDISKMLSSLEPLHDLLQNGAETLREISFQNAFGRDLNNAYEWVNNYKQTKDKTNLNQAWDIYYNVFRKISKQLPSLQTLELPHVSPKLFNAHDLELAVPGTNILTKEIVKISSFEPVFSVISSKQRPRKVNILGSDGKQYQYVLKGHEDIRQDSLVMQLFGLVNTLLKNDDECFRRHLNIQQYPAIPLSPKSGILGWVQNSDTFHVLIKEYREARKIPLNLEHWVILQMAPDFDNLTLLEKVEVFTHALENTQGQDLYKVLWFKSRSSESWLERRTIYTRSLAVMSMAGYILGLGDRHPSNLMLNRITGKVVHIDFGDCFEAAILREKFPEKVPFRLTRMLRKAMEVSGIEGTFRITCENVMRVLRDNKESLMAILEAFAFDPLIHWGFDLSTEKIIEQTGIDLPSTNPNDLLRENRVTVEEAAKMEIEQKNAIRNARALLVLKRITNKLTGNDIGNNHELAVPEQVEQLIQQAISVENLCQHYIGWCPFW
ncbi:phosphatidylinositol kinase family protein NDAI_0D01470 [Naumovozyma dairenensis CBS 421]|uniref:Serine/threonine-protein kinase TOR n=1 Tax=Naumovozyma dairenensis (strain ATCC 10597 / BCRC 20456 / CBS 421 / NBRC 0211 / NRRL Y-12639) TaxID=1071378 RepID=G0W9K0_NAUDC|nr:hypothetical protein NDAI_0D01470 [Naumovozyma dairenensis CBS 421]CCD24461.1 hypothetical protein NDAI_0D01470 [Naumovozyma dairenensis CBS 421]